MDQCAAKTKDGKQCQIPVKKGQKYCHVHRRQRVFRWLLFSFSVGTVLLGIISFIANVTGILGYFGFDVKTAVPTIPAFENVLASVQIEGTDNNVLVAYNDNGFPIWRKVLDSKIAKALIDDIDGDGKKEVFVGFTFIGSGDRAGYLIAT